MPMFCNNIGIAYFMVPKAACSSIKTCLHGLETGQAHDRSKDGPIHRLYRTTGFEPADADRSNGMWTFAVVRDPVKRILSTWSNKLEIIGRYEKQRGQILSGSLAALSRRLLGRPDSHDGLSLRPGLDEYCLNLRDYRQSFQVIRHHTHDHAHFMGPDLDMFDRIYRIEDLSELEADLTDRLGREVRLPKENSSSRKATPDMLSDAAFAALLDYTASDYAYLSDFYRPPLRNLAPATRVEV